MSLSALPEERLPLQDLGRKLDEKDGLPGPHLALLTAADGVRGDPGGEAGAVADALDDAGDKGGAVELAHLTRHTDVGVDQRLVVDDHVLVGRVRVRALLQPVRLPPEQVRPRPDLNQVQERDDVERPRLRPDWFSEEEEVEEFEADRMALEVQSKYVMTAGVA